MATSDKRLELVWMDPNEIAPNPLNWRKHPEYQKKALDNLLNKAGWAGAALYNKRTGRLIDGHLRREEAITRKEQMPVLVGDWSEAEERLILAQLDPIGDMAKKDSETLQKLIAQVSQDGGGLTVGSEAEEGVASSVLEQFGRSGGENQFDILSPRIEENIAEMGQVFDLKENVQFEGVGRYDLPSLRPDKLLVMDAPNIWVGPKYTKTKPPYFYNYHSDSTLGLDWAQAVVGFYVDDSRFEDVYYNAANTAKRFLNMHIMGMVCPNFSTAPWYPKALRIYNCFRSRWVGRYYQEAGINVIPDINMGPGDEEFVFDGLPKGCPVSIQVHQNWENDSSMLDMKRREIDFIFKVVDPKMIWAYGTKEKTKLFPSLSDPRVQWITPRWPAKSKVLKDIKEGAT